MTVPAVRFKFLDKETNVAVSDFMNSNSSDILNAAAPELTQITSQLTALVEGNKVKDVKDALAKVAGLTSIGTSRITKDFFSSFSDIGDLKVPDITRETEKLFPDNPVIQNSFGQIGDKCRDSILSAFGKCRNKKTTATFGGQRVNTSNKSCAAGSFAALINQLSGNDSYAPKLLDQCAMTRMVTAVARRGFEIGLPNVFSTLSSMIEDDHLLAQSGVDVLEACSADGNVRGIMDVADSRVGGQLLALDPNLASKVMGGFKMPGEILSRDVGGFYTNFSGAMGKLDPNWVTSRASGSPLPSVENVTSKAKGFLDVVKGKLFQETPALSLDGIVPPPSYEAYLAAGLQLDSLAPKEELKKSFSFLPVDLSKNKSMASLSFLDTDW